MEKWSFLSKFPQGLSTRCCFSTYYYLYNNALFLGAYKDVSRAVPKCTSLLAPLENAIKGMSGLQKVVWTDDLKHSFIAAKDVLNSPSALVLSKKSNRLLITVDASPLNQGLAGHQYLPLAVFTMEFGQVLAEF